MSNDFVIQWIHSNTVKITGGIDEVSNFDELLKSSDNEIFIDLGGVTRINSSGVRQWIWGIDHLKGKLIHLINCSFVVVDQLSMVNEFLGRGNRVDSFQARYVCNVCKASRFCTFKVGVDIIPGLKEYTDAPERKCPTCKNIMEFDHNPETYLYFLTQLTS